MFGKKREVSVRDEGEKLKLNVNKSRASHRPVLNTPCWEGSLDLDPGHATLKTSDGNFTGDKEDTSRWEKEEPTNDRAMIRKQQ